MKVNYSDKEVQKARKSIFLAGPTPRSLDVPSWRPEAIKILSDLGFNGMVYVPEKEVEDREFDLDEQVWWEREALHNADVIVFWVPRVISDMPAFTTNIEFGYWLAKEPTKVLYGRPDKAEKIKYLDWLYETETTKKPINNLKELLQSAIDMI